MCQRHMAEHVLGARTLDGDELEFLVLINHLYSMLEIGLAILSGRGKVPVDCHLFWRRQGSTYAAGAMFCG